MANQGLSEGIVDSCMDYLMDRVVRAFEDSKSVLPRDISLLYIQSKCVVSPPGWHTTWSATGKYCFVPQKPRGLFSRG